LKIELKLCRGFTVTKLTPSEWEKIRRKKMVWGNILWLASKMLDDQVLTNAVSVVSIQQKKIVNQTRFWASKS